MVSDYTWGALPYEQRLHILNKLINRDGDRCAGCGKKKWLTVDHIMPICRGGPVCDLTNLQLLCVRCHQNKSREDQI